MNRLDIQRTQVSDRGSSVEITQFLKPRSAIGIRATFGDPSREEMK